MSEGEFQVLRGIGLTAALALALLLQRITPHAGQRASWSVNGGLWCANLVVIGVACGACACTVARWAASHHVGVLNGMAAPWWVATPVTIAVLDLVSYAWHRANHRIAFLWRFHQVHHSDPTFTASTALRFHPGELLLSLPVRLTAVAAIGASAESIVLFEIVFGFFNLLEHGDIDLPVGVERIVGRAIVTPGLHRRHHTKRGPDRDTNFGTIFAVWDRCLGTRADSDSTIEIETGLPGLDALDLRRALVLPLQQFA